MDEVSPDMAVVEVVLEQRRDLSLERPHEKRGGAGHCGLASTEQISIEQSIKS